MLSIFLGFFFLCLGNSYIIFLNVHSLSSDNLISKNLSLENNLKFTFGIMQTTTQCYFIIVYLYYLNIHGEYLVKYVTCISDIKMIVKGFHYLGNMSLT